MTLLLRDVEVHGHATDVLLSRGTIVEVAPRIEPDGRVEVFDGDGGALLPGLADHHLHLLAMAAERWSVDCSPAAVGNRAGLREALRAGPPGAWVRGVRYDESSTGGPLDRWTLDALADDRPVRLQHRGGALWILNSRAVRELRLADAEHPGVERDAAAEPTGRIWRADGWLRERLERYGAHPSRDPWAELAGVSRELAALGVTTVTDATPDLPADTVRAFAAARADGRLTQRLHLLGADDVPARHGVTIGPRKIVIEDHELPSLPELADRISGARQLGRAVAVHCVSREALVLLLAAFDELGTRPGDRIEHAALIPPEFLRTIRELGLRVVTQPGFVAAKGDHYRAEVDPADLPDLYRHASLLDAGVPVAASSDAPYGPVDPWRILRAARDRRTDSGQPLGSAEAVPVARTLAGMLSDPADPGGRAREIVPGTPADLCLLRVPLDAALHEPDATHVRLVLSAGQPVFDAA